MKRTRVARTRDTTIVLQATNRSQLRSLSSGRKNVASSSESQATQVQKTYDAVFWRAVNGRSASWTRKTETKSRKSGRTTVLIRFRYPDGCAFCGLVATVHSGVAMWVIERRSPLGFSAGGYRQNILAAKNCWIRYATDQGLPFSRPWAKLILPATVVTCILVGRY
jgi:hypothetical protein